MREWRGGADPLDNGTAASEMDRDHSLPSGENNFEFAFNSSNFSDRVLRIEVMAETLGAGVGAGIGWDGHRKRRRNDGSKEEGEGTPLGLPSSPLIPRILQIPFLSPVHLFVPLLLVFSSDRICSRRIGIWLPVRLNERGFDWRGDLF